MSTDAPALARPPGPQLSPLELARLLRRRQMTTLLERAARQSPGIAHFRMGFEHAYLVSTPELVKSAKEHFDTVQTKDQKYVSMLSPEDKPAMPMGGGGMGGGMGGMDF